MRAWWIAGTVYFLVAAGSGAAMQFGLHRSPFWYPDPWFAISPTEGASISLLAGLALGIAVVVSSRWGVKRFRVARQLKTELHAVVQTIPVRGIVPLAILSALGEELFFRALLQPLIGVVPQAVIFGVIHQTPGAARWLWAGWAGALGLVFGCLFAATGSLIGPLVAHALVNALNLFYLREPA
jgi:uncharacterized protein